MSKFLQVLIVVLSCATASGRLQGGSATMFLTNETDFEVQSTVYGTNDKGERQNFFDLGVLQHGGSGCPGYSVSVTDSFSGGDEATITVLFDQYVAETYGNQRRARKSCNIALPVRVGAGLQLGVFQVDYRGFATVPDNDRQSYARFTAEYFFAGSRGPRQNRNYGRGRQYDDEWFERDKIGAIVWSPCGATTNFRINTALTAVKSRFLKFDEVSIGMDSADITQSFRYLMRWRSC